MKDFFKQFIAFDITFNSTMIRFSIIVLLLRKRKATMNDLFGKRKKKCNIVIIKDLRHTHTQILKERKRDTYRSQMFVYSEKKKTYKEAVKDDGWT